MISAIEELDVVLDLLNIERKEERVSYRERFLNMPLADRKVQGLSWYPVGIVGEEIGLGDRLVLEIERNETAGQAGIFSTGSVASLWLNLDSKKKPPSVSGVVVKCKDDRLWLALEGDELPEWVEDGKLGLDLYYDERTYDKMEVALKEVKGARGTRLAELRDVLLGHAKAGMHQGEVDFVLSGLNVSQNEAVNLLARAQDVAVIHGPPGTGKTTTLVRGIAHTLKREKQVLVCAASNLAVDLLTEKLALAGIRVLRLGHPARVSEEVLSHSMDMQVAMHPAFKEMRGYRRDADKIRKKALKFKRQFGRAERAERRELLNEARHCQGQARMLEKFILKDLVDRAEAITCTLAGSASRMLGDRKFSTLFIDEAAQALEPGCWIPICRASRVIFAGDHWQLPPTVKSRTAAQKGLGISLFEKVMKRQDVAVMLCTQYRMHAEIMAFPSQHFYGGALDAAASVADHHLAVQPEEPLVFQPVTFIDTAGCGYEEVLDQESLSRSNPGEADLLLRHLSLVVKLLPLPSSDLSPADVLRIGLISPYKDQVRLLRKMVDKYPALELWKPYLHIDTVDGFQGQERDLIYISLVRSNSDGEIGFLGDIRRMNVAMTRARKKLVVIGDSATLGKHKFYQAFLDYIESIGAYVSAWEYFE